MQPDLDGCFKVVGYQEVGCQQVCCTGGQDGDHCLGICQRIDALLDGPISTPDEQHIGAVGHGAPGVLGGRAALGHFIPEGIWESFTSEDLSELPQAATEALS